MSSICLPLAIASVLIAGKPDFEDVEVCEYIYRELDDCQIRAISYRLPGKDERPAILWIHGGAFTLGSRLDLQQYIPWALAKYLQAGFVVISIDYRLAPETKIPDIIQDVEHAYRWTRQKGPERLRIDPDRIAVVGHSAGGGLALMAGFRLKPRPKAIVSFYGQSGYLGEPRPPEEHDPNELANFQKQAKAAIRSWPVTNVPGESDFEKQRFKHLAYCGVKGEEFFWAEVFGFDPFKNRKRHEPFSTVANVTKAYPPTLLLHGDQDDDVPYSESVRMAGELKEHGVEHELITLVGYGHVFEIGGKGDKTIEDAYDTVAEFLRQRLAMPPN